MSSAVRYLLLVGLLVGGTLKSQFKKDPVAKFSFNSEKDYDEITKRKVKLVGTAFTEDRFGNAGNAVYLFGNENSYINLGTGPHLKHKEATISMWVKMELEVNAGKGTTVNPVLLTKCADREDFYEAYAFIYSLESKRMQAVSSRDSTRQICIYDMNDFTRLAWHHLVVAYDYDYLLFYIDGKLQEKAIKKYETEFNPLDSVMVGTTASIKNARYLNGAVDDIEFFDHVLTDAQVKQLYEAPNPNRYRVILDWILLALGFVGIIIIIYFFIRYRLSLTLKKEQQRLELYNIVLETELRVNRALMNPHFVFNSLNALQNFILKNQNAQANHYLVKFSKLMRRILESNMSDVITLEFEIQLLQSYLEIEDLRFEENIQYSVTVEPGIVPSAIKIPIMMLQPFVENAIWHGLLKKEGEKLLSISFSVIEDKYVLCTIEDNGPGRRVNDTLNLEKSSLATGFIEQRLNLLNRIHHLNCTLTIEDKPNGTGTVVKILLPILKSRL